MSAKKAKELYRKFREAEPGRIRRVAYDPPKTAFSMGYCEAILYTTTHNGKAVMYKHTFAKGSRPLLCAGPKKNQLLLVGGRFRVTERGIVDLTPRGREIED
jgi:hypothetical protein